MNRDIELFEDKWGPEEEDEVGIDEFHTFRHDLMALLAATERGVIEGIAAYMENTGGGSGYASEIRPGLRWHRPPRGEGVRSYCEGCPSPDHCAMVADLNARLAALKEVVKQLPKCEWLQGGKPCGRPATFVCVEPDPSEPGSQPTPYCEECATDAGEAVWVTRPLPYRSALLALKGGGNG
jgi:hypothetical protein